MTHDPLTPSLTPHSSGPPAVPPLLPRLPSGQAIAGTGHGQLQTLVRTHGWGP